LSRGCSTGAGAAPLGKSQRTFRKFHSGISLKWKIMEIPREARAIHDHFNRGQLSIQAFFSQSKLFKKLSKCYECLEKSLERKPTPIEVTCK